MAEQEGTEQPAENAPDQYQQTLDDLDRRHAELSTQLQQSREDVARLEGRLEAQPPPEKPKEYTRAELREAVENETLTQDRADAIWETQLTDKVTREAAAAARAEAAALSRQEKHDAAVAKYTTAHPELADKSSAKFRRVEQKYRELLAGGQPEGRSTELVALELTLGSADIPADTTDARRESHAETGGSGGGKPGKPAAEGAGKVPAKYRDHYAHMIEIGQYEGWDDPKIKAELSYMKGA